MASASSGSPASVLVPVADLPGDANVAHLNAELARVLARDVLSVLDTTPRSAWPALVRPVLARLVTVEAQLLTEATVEAIERQTKLLGHAPRSFGAFASETAAAWR